MANEIKAYHRSGKNIYAIIRNASGQAWNGSAFEAWGTGGHTAADYDIALTDKSGSLYLGDFPACAAGYYQLIFYDRATASPLDTDYAIGHEVGYWDGTTWYDMITYLYTISTNITALIADTDKVINVYSGTSQTVKSITTGNIQGVIEDD